MPHESLASGNGAETPAVVVFRITDTGEVFHVEARPGVTTVAAGGPARADAVVALPERLWLELLLGVKGVGEALLEDGLEAAGDLGRFVLFHRRFATGGGRGGDGELPARFPRPCPGVR
jgi:hypothetical protein